MSEVIRFEADGGEVLVEVADDDFAVERVAVGAWSASRVARDGRGVIEAGKRLEAVMSAVLPTSAAIAGALAQLRSCDREVEFGIKLNGEAGVLIAKTAMEGHFTVRVSWPRDV